MLCDIALKTLERAAEVTRRRLVKSTRPTDPIETEAGIDTLCRAIRNGQRFVLSPLFVETAAQLAEPRAVERSRDYIFAPADITWLEWEGDAPGGNPRSRRHALLLVGEGAGPAANRNTIMLGWGAYFALDGDPFPLIFSYDLPATDRPILRWQRSPVEMLSGLPDAHIDRGALGLGEQLSETGGRALHHVRAFLRIQRGRVQLVRPHWRGNPRFGVIRHRYIALRAEDEPGSWQGGPLPGPHMIDELTDKSGGEQ